MSFAPVYTEREFDYAYPSVLQGDFKLTELKGKDYTEFSEEKYTVRTEYNDNDAKETEYKYDFKTLIDNSSLFLAIRNKKIDKEASYSMPVVHPSYGAVQTIKLTHFADMEKETTFDYNGQATAVNFTVKGISFGVSSSNASGTPQLVFVQDGEKNGINKSLMISYVEPLVEYSSFNKLGALVYTLKSAAYA